MSESEKNQVFRNLNIDDRSGSYNAYEEDIALVNFYFEESTIFQYYRERRMTIVAMISQIGGVLGLFLGFSLVSFVELFYWFILRSACIFFKKRQGINSSP